MARYFTDFSDVSISDFTARWNTANVTWSIQDDAGATGGKILRGVDTSSGHNGLSWNVIDGDADRGNVEILIRSRVSVDAFGHFAGCFGRGSGNDASRTYYATVFYDLTRQRIARVLETVFASLSQYDNDFAANTWYWTRFRINEDTLKVKRWAGAVGDEPGSWQSEVTNEDITAAGWVGLVCITSATHEYDVIGVGTNGDTAPHEAVADPPR